MAGPIPQDRGAFPVGCSSFGMSGVNAHGIFTAAEKLDDVATLGQVVRWEKARHWLAPAPRHMLSSTVFDRPSRVVR